MSRPFRTWLPTLLGPMMLAACAAIGAVWVETSAVLRDGDAWLVSRLLLGGFVVAFLLGDWADHRGRTSASTALIGVMALCALGVVASGRSGTASVLLVVVVGALGARLSGRMLLLVMLALNAVVLALLLQVWALPPRVALIHLMAYAGFQAFAATATRLAAESARSAEALRTVNAQLLATRALLDATARDSERLRLSRELHDVAGHKLTALKLNLRQLQRDPALAGHDGLSTAVTLADDLLEDLRGVVRQLRAHDGIELGPALARLAEPLPRPRVRLDIDPDARPARPEHAACLLRVAQEGLTNAARHGGAQSAWLQVAREPGAVRLVLDDDGHVRWPLQDGNGLSGMRERLAALGGTLALSPSPHGGLRIDARLPTEIPV